MKRWMKTLAGKITLFVVSLLSVVMFAASIFGIWCFTGDNMYFYRTSEANLVNEIVADNYLRKYTDEIMWDLIYQKRDGKYDVAYQVTNAKQEVVAESENFTKGAYNVWYYVYGEPIWQYAEFSYAGIYEDRLQSYGDRYDMGNMLHDLIELTESPETTAVEETTEAVNKKTQEEAGQTQKESLIQEETEPTETEQTEVLPEETWSGITGVEIYKISVMPMEGSYAEMELHMVESALHAAYAMRYAVYGIAVVSFVLMIVSFILLKCAAGRSAEDSAFHPGPFYKVPYDILLVGFFVIGAALTSAKFLFVSNTIQIIIFFIFAGYALVGGLGLCYSAAVRIRQNTLLANTLIGRIAVWCWKHIGGGIRKTFCLFADLLRALPLVWKVGVTFGGIALIELVCSVVLIQNQPFELMILWAAETILLFFAVLYVALQLRKLKQGAQELADGDLSHQVDTKGMTGEFRKHGENLNNIAMGMAIAVEDRVRSERMKTELITNVSHDIKTPLTSIISYAGLIGAEKCDNQKVTEYAEVLVRQSEKLKRLIEDLVEASKASTGNLDVMLSPCDAAVFLSQAGGEYEERLEKSQLSLITKLPEQELRIQADGRRMWRIFDNLMNNICKYALPGTRVYLSLEKKAEQAVITFKNTSREPLDMTEEELMERFTRGDSSRSTEGSGLGLSIAKSMAQLQGGELHLEIDGDLFKAILSFPLIQE